MRARRSGGEGKSDGVCALHPFSSCLLLILSQSFCFLRCLFQHIFLFIYYFPCAGALLLCAGFSLVAVSGVCIMMPRLFSVVAYLVKRGL